MQTTVPMLTYENAGAAADWLDSPYTVDGVHVVVEGLDEHHARAVEGGAEILRGIDDEPFGRLYTAADPEGHRWMFFEAKS